MFEILMVYLGLWGLFLILKFFDLLEVIFPAKKTAPVVYKKKEREWFEPSDSSNIFEDIRDELSSINDRLADI